jgi:hypothetical protein
MVQKENVQAGLIIRSTALFKFHASTALFLLHAYVPPADGTKRNCAIVVSTRLEK